MRTVNTNLKQLLNSYVVWQAIAIAILIAVYVPTFKFFWSRWQADTQYSLAPLVPFISGYFLWKKWPQVKELKIDPSIWGVYVIGFALLIHLAATVIDISGPSGMSVFICLIGLLMAFHSLSLVRLLAFPLVYLFFAVPVPGGILDIVGFPLQIWASATTAHILSACGMEVARSGVNLSVPGFDFKVAIACSGMSSLVALVGVTAVFAYITRLPILYKCILFALAMPIALAANVVRIITIALVGYQFGADAATNIYHDWSSPLLFMAAIAFMLLINRIFEKICKIDLV